MNKGLGIYGQLSGKKLKLDEVPDGFNKEMYEVFIEAREADIKILKKAIKLAKQKKRLIK